MIAAVFLLGWLAVMTLPRLALAMGAVASTRARRARGARVPLSVTGIAPASARRRACWCSITRATWMPLSWLPPCPANRPTSPRRSSPARCLPARCCVGWALFLERFDVTDSLADLDSVTAAAHEQAPARVLSRGHVHAPGRALRLLSRRLQGRGRRPSCRCPRPCCAAPDPCCGASRWFPRWTPISVTIETPIPPTGHRLRLGCPAPRRRARRRRWPTAENPISASSSNPSGCRRPIDDAAQHAPIAPRSTCYPSPRTSSC